jgi:hypothetical protein
LAISDTGIIVAIVIFGINVGVRDVDVYVDVDVDVFFYCNQSVQHRCYGRSVRTIVCPTVLDETLHSIRST